jgi:hypothetical protein
MAGCCECGDEPSGSCAMELVSYLVIYVYIWDKTKVYFVGNV